MIKAALFDLDGVVVDTEGQYTTFWGDTFRRYYPDEPGLEHRIKGMTLVQIYSRYFDGREDIQQAITQGLDDFERKMDYPYIPGVVDFLRQLRAHGVATAVVTSSNVPKMTNVYRCHPEFQSYFNAILTSEDFERSKPDPDCYLKAAQRVGAMPGECMGFEDSINGLRSVSAAKMHVVALATTNPKETLRQWSDTIIDDFRKLSLQRLSERWGTLPR